MMTGRRDGRLGRRRFLSGASAGLVATLAGCPELGEDASPTPGTEPTATLTTDGRGVHMLTDYYSDAWQTRWDDELVPAFRRETGIDVTVEYLGMGHGRLEHLIEAGDTPDLNTSTFGRIVDAGAIEDVAATTSVVERATARNGELVARPFERNGEFRQVPHGYRVATFLYRTDVYEQLGLDVPTSLAAVVANARAIDESDLAVRGYGLAGTVAGKSTAEFQTYLAQMGQPPLGLRWADPDERRELVVQFPEAAVTALLSFFESLAQYSPEPTALGWPESFQYWLAGGRVDGADREETPRIAQQFHVNNWPAGLAARQALRDGDQSASAVVERTGVAPLPSWSAGGVDRGDSWLFQPALEGYHVFATGENPTGAREWLTWLYGNSAERTAGQYAPEPTRLLPAYDGVLSRDAYRTIDLFREWPRLLDQLEFVRNTVVADHYGNVPEADLDDPVAMAVGRRPFYGEMIHRVVTGADSPKAAYEWGREQLTDELVAARERLR